MVQTNMAAVFAGFIVFITDHNSIQEALDAKITDLFVYHFDNANIKEKNSKIFYRIRKFLFIFE